jgi:hypothetical protein
VFKPIVITDEDNNNSIKLVRLFVEKISMIRSDTFSVHVKLDEGEKPDDDVSSYNRYGNSRDKDDNEVMFSTKEMTTSMFLMQFPDEVKKALDDITKTTSADEARVNVLTEEVNSKLAEYAVLASLKEK